MEAFNFAPLDPRLVPHPSMLLDLLNPYNQGDRSLRSGSYEHPQPGPAEYWYFDPFRKCTVYLFFERKPEMFLAHHQFREAMDYAFDNMLHGVRIRREWTVKKYIPEQFLQPGQNNDDLPYEPWEHVLYEGGAFNADYHTILDIDELVFLSKIREFIHLVEYNGKSCVYKFVYEWRNQELFE